MSAVHSDWVRKPHDFFQSAADPVALDGITDLFGHGKAEADGPVIGPFTRLQHKTGGRYLGPGRRCQKVRPLLQSFHKANAAVLNAAFS